MSDKISIDISDLQAQQQTLSTLASETSENYQKYSGLLERLTNAVSGKMAFNIKTKGRLSLRAYTKLATELKTGADVSQKCIDAYYSCDKELEKQAQNMNQVLINDYGGDSSQESQSNQTISGDICDKYKNDPRYISLVSKLEKAGYSGAKLVGMKYAAAYMLDAGYEEAFIIGICANIAAEGTPGRLESSAYSSREKEPAYLRYVDDNYNYRKDFSNKTITEVGLDKLENLVNNLNINKGSGNFFGIGMVQWTSSNRVNNLLKCYREVCGDNNYPTAEQCAQAEALYMCRELQGYYSDANYSRAYNTWKNTYCGQNTEEASRAAADIICRKFEVPADIDNQANNRSNNASKIYNS